MYWCEITVHSGPYSCLLRGASAGTPRLAVRWLQSQADRLADLMDPQPGSPWVPVSRRGAVPLCYADADARDVPEELRTWSRNTPAHEYAMHALAAGALFRFASGDGSAEISLSARPVPVAVPTTGHRLIRECAAA